MKAATTALHPMWPEFSGYAWHHITCISQAQHACSNANQQLNCLQGKPVGNKKLEAYGCPYSINPHFMSDLMDRSAAELAKVRGKWLWVPKLGPSDIVPLKSWAPSVHWDWRALDKVTRPKRQGLCGSCWAFAAAGAIESKLLIQYNKTNSSYPVDLSEQQIVDCASDGSRTGCSGGNFEQALFYAAK